MPIANRFLPLVGRILLSLIFVVSGLFKIPGWEMTKAYMAAEGMPMVSVLLVAAIVVETLGGLSVLLGFKARIGAIALFLFLIPTTLIFHDFWTLEGMEQQLQLTMFLKNLAIMGALLLVAYWGPGPMSLQRGHAAPIDTATLSQQNAE